MSRKNGQLIGLSTEAKITEMLKASNHKAIERMLLFLSGLVDEIVVA